MSFSTLACAICFAAAHGPLLDAARLGVLVMVAVTCAVLTLFARFFLRISKNGDSRTFETGTAALSKRGQPQFSGGAD